MADAKLSALTALTTPISTDICYVVDDPGGSPLSKKVTLANLGKGITQIVTADESTDTTCFPLFATAATGAVAPKTDTSNYTYNSNTGQLSCTGFTGALTGNADTVTTNADLTGIVTSIGNATAIADKAIATSKLADGTDGELITWDASGVISHVPVGAATHVLTSNGAGAAPTFQAAGGGASKYDATVGSSGADYTTCKAAVDAGKTHLLAIANTTETAITTLAANTYLYIKDGINLDFGDYAINSSTYNLTVQGEGRAKITYAFTSGKRFIAGTGGKFTADSIIIDNNSTNDDTCITFLETHLNNIKIELPNQDNAGINTQNPATYSNIELVGAGSSCTNSCSIGAATYPAIGTNILLTGSWSSAADSVLIQNNSSINGLTTDCDTDVVIQINQNAILSDVTARVNNVDIDFGGSQGVLANAFLLGGDIDIKNTGNLSISNVYTTGSLDMTDASANNNLITNCKFDTAMTVAGDRNKFNNCDFIGGVSVSSGGNDNGIINCQAGADAGGGALTITVVAGSNRTRIVGCMTDAAIIDNGTGTVTAGNTVY